MNRIRKGSRCFLIPVIILILSACGETQVQKAATDSAPGDKVVQPNEFPEAFVTFITGNVVHINSGTERMPEIGDSIAMGDSLETGPDGYVELQFGSLGAIRIQADSLYRLDSIELTDDRERVSGSLATGSLLAKIRSLADRDGFEVTVPGAVCAVRGTEFLIRSDEHGSITIAVAEGSVAVSPPSLAEVGSVSELTGDLSQIRALMPLVSANEEILFTSDVLSGVEIELASLSTEEPESLEPRIRSVLSAVPAVVPIRSENSAILEEEIPQLLQVTLESGAIGVGSEAGTPMIPVLVPLTVITDPADAQIYLDNRLAGRGNVSQVFPEAVEISVSAVSSDGRRMDRTLIAGTDSVVEFTFEELEDEPKTDQVDESVEVAFVATAPAEMQVIVEQRDALIFVDGRNTGNGTASLQGESGDQLSLRIERPGYSVYSRNITLRPDAPPLRVKLEAELIIAKSPLPAGPGVGTPAASRNFVVGATESGTLYAVNRNGALAWTLSTENQKSENINPVISDGKVYMIGDTELVIVNAANGRVLSRKPLSGDSADLFGRRLLPRGGQVVLPADGSLIFINPESGEPVEVMGIPNGSRMSPAAWNNQILIADQRGTLLFIDPDDKQVTNSIATAANQPVGQAPAVSGDLAVFSGRRGTVVAVNLRRKQVIWERALDPSGSVRVHSDAVVDNGVVYVHGKGTLYAMSLENGEDQFPPIPGVSAPPLIRGGYMFLSRNDGILAVHSSRNGGFVGEFLLGEVSKARPASLGPYLVTATENSIFVLDPRSMTE